MRSFNKIGTYTHSVLAKEHKIPFYVAAPISTFDFTLLERDITIEEWSPDELRRIRDVMLAPAGALVHNPAFDTTPVENVTAIITEDGVMYSGESRGVYPLQFRLCRLDRLPCSGDLTIFCGRNA